MNEYHLSQYSDEQLIEFSHRGEGIATDFLLEKYKPLVRKKARVLYLMGGENEDLIQEGMIALYKAIREFNPRGGSPFSSFANSCIENQLYNVIKQANRLKNSPLNTYISLDSPMGTKKDDSASHATLADTLQPTELINPEDIMIDRENVTDIESVIRKRLSPFEQDVVRLYIDGCTHQQIAEKLNKNVKSVDNALQRVKKKMTKFPV